MLMFFPLAIACSGAEPPSGGLVFPADNAEQVFAVDFDGDGYDEVALLKDGVLTTTSDTHRIDGAIVASSAVQADNSKGDSLYIVTGRSRTYPDAIPSIHRISSQGFETIYTAQSKSQRISDLQSENGRVFITLMGGDKNARGGFIENGEFRAITQSPMGLKQIPLNNGSTVIGRLYGDQPRSDGELVLVDKQGATTKLSSKRGVRTLVAHDINSDGHLDLLVGDGWHYQYGKRAEPSLRILLGPDFEDERLVAELPSGFTISQIVPVSSVQKGEPNRIVVLGTDGIYLLEPELMGWKRTHLSKATQSTHIDVCNTPTGPKLLVSGTPIDVISLP